MTGKGEDAGVVYCEMQARENSGESLAFHEMKQAIYPEPSGYRYNEGGVMKNLRETCSNLKVRIERCIGPKIRKHDSRK